MGSIAGLLLAASSPSLARAESALLESVSIGGALLEGGGRPSEARFLIGCGVDWLDASGATLALRAQADHTLESSLALLGGWSGPGIRTDRGLPLGLLAGGAARIDLLGDAAVGARAVLVLGLWYDRAAVELDLTAWRLVGPVAHEHPEADTALLFSLTLRLVPWSPQTL